MYATHCLMVMGRTRICIDRQMDRQRERFQYIPLNFVRGGIITAGMSYFTSKYFRLTKQMKALQVGFFPLGHTTSYDLNLQTYGCNLKVPNENLNTTRLYPRLSLRQVSVLTL